MSSGHYSEKECYSIRSYVSLNVSRRIFFFNFYLNRLLTCRSNSVECAAMRLVVDSFLFVPLAAYQEMIPFVKPAPIDEMEAKKQAKKGAAEKKETKGEE